ncbi:DMT family transporter [Dethiothermospora halolimnae]|uniref:DMT family transporter n=1 Tax=Dethiothermospora halolimnae TaxID=3114390 RepID=UPI003CCB81D7
MDTEKLFTNKITVVIIALICCVLWGSAFPVLKTSYIELGMEAGDLNAKVVFAGMRFFIASILLFIVLVFFIKHSLKVKGKVLLELFGLGLLQTSLQYFFFYNGLANTTGIKGAILASIGTFFVVLLAHFVYHDDKMNLKKVVGLISGFLGIFLVNIGKGGFNLEFSLMGEGFLIMAGLVSAFGTILAKRISKGVHPFLVTGWQMFLGSLVLLLIGYPRLSPDAMTFTPKAWGLLFYAAFLSATAFSLWYTLLKYNKAGEISLYKFIVPVSGSLLSVIFLPGEKLTSYMVIALLLVSVGIIAVNYKRKKLIDTKNK